MLSKTKVSSISKILILVIIIGMGVNKVYFRSIIETSEIALENIAVLDEVIKIQGAITSSGKISRSHRVSYKDGALFLKVIGGLKGFSPVKQVDIEIINQYGEINEIYIMGSTSVEKRIVSKRQSN